MCGRYALHHPVDEIHERFSVQAVLFTQPPRYNIAPTQLVAVVSPERKLGAMRWGLVPRWSKDGRPFINARGETLSEKPAFRDCFRRRRVLVPASGFHEWKGEGGAKRPVHIRRPDGALFAMAGIWEPGAEVPTLAIVTMPSNTAIAAVHDRMPAVLRREDEAAWLDPRNPSPEACLRTDDDGWALVDVSPRLNGVRDDDASLLEPT